MEQLHTRDPARGRVNEPCTYACHAGRTTSTSTPSVRCVMCKRPAVVEAPSSGSNLSWVINGSRLRAAPKRVVSASASVARASCFLHGLVSPSCRFIPSHPILFDEIDTLHDTTLYSTGISTRLASSGRNRSPRRTRSIYIIPRENRRPRPCWRGLIPCT